MSNIRNFTACSLFSGTGGSAKGLDMVGRDGKGAFDDRLAVDFDKHAEKCFKANFDNKNYPDLHFYRHDISKIDGQWIREKCRLKKGQNLDFMTLSPPCQPWTMQNQNHGKYDSKMELMFQAPRLIGQALPLIAVTENVAGMASPATAKHFDKVKFEFSRISYETKMVILDSAYYGVPQRRQRLLFISIRHDVLSALNHFDPIADSFVPPKDETQLEEFKLENQVPGTCFYANQQYGERKVPANAIIPTITTSKIFFFKEVGGEVEKFTATIAELKKLSSFPDDFILDGDENNPKDYKKMQDRIGNCVPPVFMERVARHLRDKFLIPYYSKLDEREAIAAAQVKVTTN